MLVVADHSGWEGEGRVILSPWLVGGVGRETRARIATRARNSIFESCIVLTNSYRT